jgi:tetratricopeptide (TPR) repeat protein
LTVRGTSYRYNTLVAMGRNDEAQAMLDELQRLAPKAVAQAYLERGTTLFEEGQIDGAIAALEGALRADRRS